MENTRKKGSKKSLFIIGIFLLIFSLLCVAFKFLYRKYDIYENNIKLETFFDDDGFKNLSLNNTDDEYIAVLEIPEIDLKRGLYESNSKLNNVDKNIEILKGSVLPNFNGGNLYLAAHSGNSNVSFFKNLDKLFIDDIIFVYYNNYKYIYVIDDIYEEIKRGYINVKLNGTNCGIVLTTCDTNNNNYQLIIKGKLIDREKY